MHDRNGNSVKVGDIVTIKFRITQVSPQTDYCNVTVETVEGRKPDGAKDTYSLNTALLVLQEAS